MIRGSRRPRANDLRANKASHEDAEFLGDKMCRLTPKNRIPMSVTLPAFVTGICGFTYESPKGVSAAILDHCPESLRKPFQPAEDGRRAESRLLEKSCGSREACRREESGLTLCRLTCAERIGDMPDVAIPVKSVSPITGNALRHQADDIPSPAIGNRSGELGLSPLFA
jgi:hypothetical protein